MNRVVYVIIFAFAVQSVVYSQLRVETAIVSQYYCREDSDLDRLTLNLNLKYTNIGSQSIILAKGSSEHSQMIVSENENGAVGGVEINPTFTHIWGDQYSVTPQDLSRLFVILKPKDSYRTKTIAGVFVLRANRSGIGGAVGNGNHFLQLRVRTWPLSWELTNRLETAWKNKGALWTRSVISEPMAFTVIPKRRLTKCR